MTCQRLQIVAGTDVGSARLAFGVAGGLLGDSDGLDAGMIFGTGFAPFRGGPIYYLEQLAHKQRERAAEAGSGGFDHVN